MLLEEYCIEGVRSIVKVSVYLIVWERKRQIQRERERERERERDLNISKNVWILMLYYPLVKNIFIVLNEKMKIKNFED